MCCWRHPRLMLMQRTPACERHSRMPHSSATLVRNAIRKAHSRPLTLTHTDKRMCVRACVCLASVVLPPLLLFFSSFFFFHLNAAQLLLHSSLHSSHVQALLTCCLVPGLTSMRRTPWALQRCIGRHRANSSMSARYSASLSLDLSRPLSTSLCPLPFERL